MVISQNKHTSIKKDLVRVLSSNLIVAIMGFINSFIFPKIMDIQDYAIYHTFTLYLSYIAFFHLGFPNGLMIKYAGKRYSDTNKKEYKSETYFLLSLLSFFSLLFIILYYIIKNEFLLYICIAIIPIDYLGSIKVLWQSWSRFDEFSKLNSLMAISIPIIALIYYAIFKTLPGRIYIIIYLFVSWILLIYVLLKETKFLKGVVGNKLLSKDNFEIEKIGFGFLLGNYINTLFTTVDKLFIKWFFSNIEFAYYSFGMSLQALMTVFITSLAQPLFPMLAKKEMDSNQYRILKNLLIIFGTFSGCAYFFASFIVKTFIIKYIPSLSVIKIYFLVFPALAIVNCLYINLYKLQNRMKEYLFTLAGILFLAICLNIIFVNIVDSFIGVAIATTITYYIWLILGNIRFNIVKLSIKDIIYIILFILLFNTLVNIHNDIIGCIIYFSIFAVLAFVFYKKDIMFLLGNYTNKFLKKGNKNV